MLFRSGITSNGEGQGEIDAIEDVQVHEQQDPNEVEYYGAEDKEGAPSELPKVSESPELIEEAGSQDIVMTTEEPTVDNGSEMWELASLAEVKNSSEQLLVNNTQADKHVVPDKYSTGASGSLKLVRKVEDIKEMIAKVGDGSIKIHLNSEGIKGVITLEDYDFTEFSTFAFMNISNCQNDVTIVFRNCKFNNFKTSVIPSKPKFIMYDCSFVNFYGSNVEF